MKKLPYAEGSVFLVPVRGGGFARGFVARMAPKGKILFGYFVGPRLSREEDATLDDLRRENAIWKEMFGDLGLYRRWWPVLGPLPNWDRSKWPMPKFARRDPTGHLLPRLVEFSDHDPSLIVSEQVIYEDSSIPTEYLAGYMAVSIGLENLLEASPDAQPGS